MWGFVIGLLPRLPGLWRRRQELSEESKFDALGQRLEHVPGPQVFISYSRTETPLVEDLVDGLKKKGINTFVDFRDLVPSRPWDHQLEHAVDASALIVLVVSVRSIEGSEHTRQEWSQALHKGKRIILALAEPVALPQGLVDREWIDLRRGRFEKKVSALADLIKNPRDADRRPPQRGLRPPTVVWVAVAMAVMSMLLVIPLVWTIALPLVLAPLPFRILRRAFFYPTVRLALGGESLLLATFLISFRWSGWAAFCGWVVFSIPLATLLVLRSGRFRRWMTPIAARQKLPPLPELAGRRPTPQRFALDYAHEDRGYVDDIRCALEREHHIPVLLEGAVGDSPSAGPTPLDIVLRFVSKFNDTADVACDVRTLPILLSDHDEHALPTELQRTQWIDLRHGGTRRRRSEIEHLTKALDQPDELLRRVGVAPPYGTTRVLPRGVQALHDLLWVCPIAVIASVFLAASPGDSDTTGPQWWIISISGVASVALVALILHRLNHRRPTRGFQLYIPILICLMWVQGWVPLARPAPENFDLNTVQYLPMMFSGFFLLGLPVGWLMTRREIARWIPPSTGVWRGPRPLD